MDLVFTKDLKKGDKVKFHGETYLITEDAINHGQQVENMEVKVLDNELDVWSAEAKIIIEDPTKKIDPTLANWNVFQSNSLPNGIYCKYYVINRKENLIYKLSDSVKDQLLNYKVRSIKITEGNVLNIENEVAFSFSWAKFIAKELKFKGNKVNYFTDSNE